MSSDDKPIAPSIFGSLESPSVSTSTKASGKFRGKENPRSKGPKKSAAADGDNAGDAKDQPSSAPGGGRGGRGGGRGGGGGRGRGDGRKGDKAAAVAPEGVDPTVQNTGADPEGTSAPATTKPKRERPPRGKGGRGGNKGDDVEAKVAGGDSANAASFKDAVAPPAPPAPVKKYFKAVVRKLPPTKDFTRGDFEQALHTCVRSLATSNGIDANRLSLPDDVFVDHFIDGKISRKRGPVNGAAFVAFANEQLYQSFLTQCPMKVPFFTDESLGQPEIVVAPYTKVTRTREKVDVKYINTFLEDPEFLAFQERCNKPETAPKGDVLATAAANLAFAVAATAAASSSSSSLSFSAAAAASLAAGGTALSSSGAGDGSGSGGTNAQRIERLLQNNALLQFLREKALTRRRGTSGKGSGKMTKKELAKERKRVILQRQKQLLAGATDGAKGSNGGSGVGGGAGGYGSSKLGGDRTIGGSVGGVGGVGGGGGSSAVAQQIDALISQAMAEGRKLTTAEKERLRLLRKKEKRKQRKEATLVAEAEALLAVQPPESGKSLTDCLRDVKKSRRSKTRGGGSTGGGRSAVGAAGVNGDNNSVVDGGNVGATAAAAEGEGASTGGAGAGGGLSKREERARQRREKLKEARKAAKQLQRQQRDGGGGGGGGAGAGAGAVDTAAIGAGVTSAAGGAEDNGDAGASGRGGGGGGGGGGGSERSGRGSGRRGRGGRGGQAGVGGDGGESNDAPPPVAKKVMLMRRPTAATGGVGDGPAPTATMATSGVAEASSS